MLMEKCPQGVVCPCPQAIYMYMTIIFKDLLLCETTWPIKAKPLCGASLGKASES